MFARPPPTSSSKAWIPGKKSWVLPDPYIIKSRGEIVFRRNKPLPPAEIEQILHPQHQYYQTYLYPTQWRYSAPTTHLEEVKGSRPLSFSLLTRQIQLKHPHVEPFCLHFSLKSHPAHPHGLNHSTVTRSGRIVRRPARYSELLMHCHLLL